MSRRVTKEKASDKEVCICCGYQVVNSIFSIQNTFIFSKQNQELLNIKKIIGKRRIGVMFRK